MEKVRELLDDVPKCASSDLDSWSLGKSRVRDAVLRESAETALGVVCDVPEVFLRSDLAGERLTANREKRNGNPLRLRDTLWPAP